jgi:hypothetical protein
VQFLLENLVVGVTGTIFSEFPDVIPHEDAGSTSSNRSNGKSE